MMKSSVIYWKRIYHNEPFWHSDYLKPAFCSQFIDSK